MHTIERGGARLVLPQIDVQTRNEKKKKRSAWLLCLLFPWSTPRHGGNQTALDQKKKREILRLRTRHFDRGLADDAPKP